MGRLNKITGILSFYSSLGVLYKYLCHDSKTAAADWFKQQFYSWQCRGAAATGILSGVSMLPALQNGHGSNLNPAHFYCASMPTPGKKTLLHVWSWESQRSLCGQHEWREVEQLQWREAEFDTSVDWKTLAEHEAWKLGLVLPFHHWGNEEEMHRSPGDTKDPSASMMNMFQTHYTIIFGLSGKYAYCTLSLQTFWTVILIFLQILFRSFHITSLTFSYWLVVAVVRLWVKMKEMPISSLL